MVRRHLAVALLVLSGALTQRAGAQSADSIDAHYFQPSPDPSGGVYLEPVLTPGPGQFNAALFVRDAYWPLTLRTFDGTSASHPIAHRLSSDLVANLGIGARGAFGLDLPVIAYQHGDDDSVARAFGGGTLPPTAALGDLALIGKFNLRAYEDLGGFGLALIVRQTLPTGSAASFTTDGDPTSEVRLLGEYKLIAAAVQATTGFRFRPTEHIVLGDAFGHAIPWGLGVTLHPQALGIDDKGRFTWGLETHGAIFFPPSAEAESQGKRTPVMPVFAALTARYAPGAVSIIAAAEVALTQALGAPTYSTTLALAWAPRVHDMDGDGIADDIDQCPELPEDRDGVEDDDGCPDYDANGK